MAAVAGYAGQVRVATGVVLDVQEWNGDFSMAELDTTALAAAGGATTLIMGLFTGKVSISANYNYADTTGQKLLQDAFFARTSVTLNLDTAASGSNRTFTGTAFVTKIGPAVKVDDLVKIDFDVRFSGAVTFA
jgi:predicted secreted protein